MLALANTVCTTKGWTLAQARFYTGIPDPTDNPFWHHFWSAKLAVMGRQGVVVFGRSLRYRNKTVMLPDASELTLPVGEEKGVDIRIEIASAYPLGPTTRNRRGISRTDWVPISRVMYDGCLDRRDYRPTR